MDYEVFILTRINEEYGDTGDTGEAGEAVVRGIGRTGRLVTSGALILCLAFVALGGVPVTDVKILATGLAAGIIVDATVIRVSRLVGATLIQAGCLGLDERRACGLGLC